MSRKTKILLICFLVLLIVCWCISCAVDNADSPSYTYKSDEYKVTDKEKENLEFYYEMEEKWNSYK